MFTACFTNAPSALPPAITSAALVFYTPRVPGAEICSLGNSPCLERYPGQGVLDTKITASSPRGATDPFKSKEVGGGP